MRVRRFRISFELFRQILSEGLHQVGYAVTKDAIPPDAELVNVRHGWPNCVEMLVRSESFSEVAEGQEIPELTPVVSGGGR